MLQTRTTWKAGPEYFSLGIINKGFGLYLSPCFRYSFAERQLHDALKDCWKDKMSISVLSPQCHRTFLFSCLLPRRKLVHFVFINMVCGKWEPQVTQWIVKIRQEGRQINPNTYHGFELYFSMLTELFITEHQRPWEKIIIKRRDTNVKFWVSVPLRYIFFCVFAWLARVSFTPLSLILPRVVP